MIGPVEIPAGMITYPDPTEELTQTRSTSSAAAPPPLPPPLPKTKPPALEMWHFDERKLTYGEWWRQLRGPSVIFAWGAKLFGARLVPDLRVPRILDYQGLTICPAELTPQQALSMQPQIEALLALGFTAPSFIRFSNLFAGNELTASTLRHRNGRTLARVSFCAPLPGNPGKEQLDWCLLTLFVDGQQLCTSCKGVTFNPPPGLIQNVCRGSLEKALQTHETRADQVGVAARPVNTHPEVIAVCDEYERTAFEHQRQRGLYLQPNAEQADADLASVTETSGDPVAASALEELRRQQKKSASWKGSLVLLVVSLVAALGIGQQAWSMGKALLIIGILFFHELGHYVAMRVFKYKDVRMFFIPLFGAAVSGRHHNVPGWRKAVVSLMGPVPGIFVGTALGAYAIAAGNESLADAASLMIFLNAFNLLPLLPLDGGWFWNAVLFCRHRVLETGFTVLAGLAGIAATLADLGKIWMYLGIATIISAFSAFRLGGVAAKLRTEGCAPLADGDDTMPDETALRIIAEMRAGQSAAKQQPKLLATEALSVFERMNARPPHWLASLGLAAVYGFTILVALIGFTITFMYSNDVDGVTPAATELSTAPPTRELRLGSEMPGEVRQWPQEIATGAELRHQFARFANESAAAGAFDLLHPQLTPAETIIQAGPWILLSSGFEDQERAGVLSSALKNAGGDLLASAENTAALDLRLTASSAEAATRLHHELDVYLRLPHAFRSTAPWQRTAEANPAQTIAAETYLRIHEAEVHAAMDPSVQRVQRHAFVRQLFAFRNPLIGSWRAIAAEQRRVVSIQVEQWLRSGEEGLDPEVLQLWLKQPEYGTNEFAAWNKEMRRAVTHEANDEWVESETYGGEAAVSDSEVTLRDVALVEPHRTFPALVRYLQREGVTSVQFGLNTQELDAE